MNRHDEALEQLRIANPIPGIDCVDAEELVASRSHFEERRLAMTTSTPNQHDTARPSQPLWRPAVIVASAFVLVLALVGAGTILLGGSEGAPIGDQPAPTPTTAATTIPPVDAEAEEPAVVEPQAPAIEPGVRVLSDRPEYGTNLVIGPDGLPLILSTMGDEYPGAVRLFRCADVACDSFTVESVDPPTGMGALFVGGSAVTDAFVAGPLGDIYVEYATNEQAVEGEPSIGWGVVRFHDGETRALPVLSNWPVNTEALYTPLPATFDDVGNPVFVTYEGSFPATANLVVCNDPVCSSHLEIGFDSATFYDSFPSVALDQDTARVLYSAGEPTGALHPEEIGMTERETQFKVATITDLYGEPRVLVEVVAEDPRTYGHLDAQMRPVRAHWETVYDPDEYAAYLAEEQRIEDEGLVDVGVEEPDPLGANLVVVRCLDPSCDGEERTTIAVSDAPWWYSDPLELEVTPDGTILVAVGAHSEAIEPGIHLHVFPSGELGEGVPPIEGHAMAGWDAR